MTVEKWQTEEEEDVTQADYRAICYLLQRAGNIGCPDSVTLIQQVQANFFKKMSEDVLPSRPVNTTVSAPPVQSQTKGSKMRKVLVLLLCFSLFGCLQTKDETPEQRG